MAALTAHATVRVPILHNRPIVRFLLGRGQNKRETLRNRACLMYQNTSTTIFQTGYFCC